MISLSFASPVADATSVSPKGKRARDAGVRFAHTERQGRE